MTRFALAFLALSASSAWAVAPTPLELFPLMGTIDLPEAGVFRVEVPALARSADDPRDGSDLQLVDARGQAVPFAVLRSDVPLTLPPSDVRVRPQFSLEGWQVDVSGAPIDGIEVLLDTDGAALVTITADGATAPPNNAPLADAALVWRFDQSASSVIALPPTRGTLQVTVERDGTRSRRGVRVLPYRRAAAPVPRAELSATVLGPTPLESGRWSYTLELPRRLPVDALNFELDTPSVKRAVTVVREDWQSDGGETSLSGELRQLTYNGTVLAHNTLPVPGPADQLRVEIAPSADGAPGVRAATLSMPGVALLVRDVGPGPLTLYAGAPVGSKPSWDLQASDAELAMLADPSPRAVDELRANPAHVPPEDRLQGELRQLPLSPARWQWQRPVTGAPGLALIALDDHALAHSRADMGDIRLIDANGAELPWLPINHRQPELRSDLPQTRVELGNTSVITVQLPQAGLPVRSVVLQSAQRAFDRYITVRRPSTRGGDDMGWADWIRDGDGTAPKVIAIYGDQWLAEAIEIRIDNRDNAPLPLDPVRVGFSQRALAVRLPDGGATMLYGNPSVSFPVYDLRQVRPKLLRDRPPGAALGAPVEREAATPSTLALMIVRAGLLALAMALIALTGIALRAKPPAPNQGASAPPTA